MNRSEIERILAKEDTYYDSFGGLRTYIEEWKQRKTEEICSLVSEHGPIRAKAFPGRAAILIKLLGLSTDHIHRVYEKPGSMKIGNYVPGTRIEIRSDEELFGYEDKDLPILNLAWHIPKEIRDYLAENGYQGKVIDIV